MRLKIAAVGHMRSGPLRELSSEYLKRLTLKMDLVELDPALDSSPIQRKQKEGKALLTALGSCDVFFALDERGDAVSSEQFSTLLQNLLNNGQSSLGFCIGGADGLSEEVREKAFRSLSFGAMTWPHMMARVMLIEQIYRAQQILAGHPYHRS